MDYLGTGEIVAYIENEWGPIGGDKKKRAALNKKIQRELRRVPGYNPQKGYELPAHKVRSFVASIADYLEKSVYEGSRTYEAVRARQILRELEREREGQYSLSGYLSGPPSSEAIAALKQAVELARIRRDFPELDVEMFLHDFAVHELLELEDHKAYESPEQEISDLELRGRMAEARLGNLEGYMKK